MTTHARAPRAFLTLATALALVAGPAAVATAAPAPAAAATVSTTAAPTALPGAVVTAKKAKPRYQTKVRTVVYTSASSATKRTTIPADYTVKAVSAKKKNSRIQVVYKGKRGWVKASKISRVSSSTKLGKMSFAGSAKKNIKKWCKGVPVVSKKSTQNRAQAWSDGSREKIILSRTTDWGVKIDANHALAVAIQYHECGHILQYRAYDYDFGALERAMTKVYPDGRHSGTEHMADCIADVMGAKRTGRLSGNQTYIAGYQGDCSKKQLKAAKRIIAGKRL